MADQQSRGGKQEAAGGGAGQSEEHQGTRADADQRPDTGTGPGGKPKDDPSEAPESGDRKATG